MNDTSKDALDRFGRTLMERVRDASIRDCDVIVDGRTKAPELSALYTRLGELSDAQREAVRQILTKCVDITLHHVLWMFDQEEWITVAVSTATGTVPSLRDVSDGLIGDKFEWIERFSSKRPST